MGWALHVRDAVVQALGGYTGQQVQEILYQANAIGDLAMTGKYRADRAVLQAARVQKLREITHNYFPLLAEIKNYVRQPRKLGVRKVEIITRERERGVFTGTGTAVEETRPECVLAKATGQEGLAQRDSK